MDLLDTVIYNTWDIQEYFNKKISEYYYTKYTDLVPLEERMDTVKRIRKRHPDKFVLILEAPGFILDTQRKRHYIKFLAPFQMSVGEFLYKLRKNIRLYPEETVYLYVNNEIPMTSSLLSDVYRTHMSPDFHLYMKVEKQAVFG